MSKKDNILNTVKKIKAVEYKGKKCNKCGEDKFWKLSFHHINEKEKEYNWRELRQRKWKDIKIELDKCELLCENCHREHHSVIEDRYGWLKGKEILLSIKGEIGCKICEYDKCNGALDFHHREPNGKDFSISVGMKRYKTIGDVEIKMLQEIEKCDILCTNCHRDEHFNHDFYIKHEKEILNRVENYQGYKKLEHEKIYELYKKGYKQVEIAKIFDVNRSTICTILKNLA